MVLGPRSYWRQPFIRYLTTIDVLADNTERECFTHNSKHYVLIDGKLYRRNAKGELLQKCVSMIEGEKILKEIHVGTCGNMLPLQHWSKRFSELISIGPQP